MQVELNTGVEPSATLQTITEELAEHCQQIAKLAELLAMQQTVIIFLCHAFARHQKILAAEESTDAAPCAIHASAVN